MNISISELLVILVVALLVIKPEQMPEMLQHAGRLVRNLRQLFNRVQNGLNELLNTVEMSDEQKHKHNR